MKTSITLLALGTSILQEKMRCENFTCDAAVANSCRMMQQAMHTTRPMLGTAGCESKEPPVGLRVLIVRPRVWTAVIVATSTILIACFSHCSSRSAASTGFQFVALAKLVEVYGVYGVQLSDHLLTYLYARNQKSGARSADWTR